MIWTLFQVLSVIGLLLSVVAHTVALFGLSQPLGPATFGLHIGIFLVGIPAAIISKRRQRNTKLKDYFVPRVCPVWMRGCPIWMCWLTYALFAYALINFMLCDANPNADGGEKHPPQVFREFSGLWMAFYSAAAATLYSARLEAIAKHVRNCPNGHQVPSSARICELCGEDVIVRPVPTSEPVPQFTSDESEWVMPTWMYLAIGAALLTFGGCVASAIFSGG